jgi:hypothetical protein
MLKRIALTTLATAAAFTMATAVMAPITPASAQVSITFGAPPPPVRYEAVPAPRAGYVWAPGHWRLANDQYVWQGGQWYQARPGYRYVPDNWERYTDNGRERWRYHASRWDRDGDGIPNKYDRYDNRHDQAQNPFGDRDHDGIPNIIDPTNNRRH